MTEPDNNTTQAGASDDQHATDSTPQIGISDEQVYRQYEKKTSKALWAIFALLLVLAGGVIFLLPRYIAPAEPAGRVVVIEQNANGQSTQALSPFAEAQRLRQREAAQNTLAELLALQEILDAKQVSRWAAEPFDEAIALAGQGDAAYRDQEFIHADELYHQGLELLQGIIADETATYQNILAQGNTALSQGNATVANDSFSLALLVNPEGEEAVIGLDRAAVLDEVMVLLAEARRLNESGDFEAAREHYLSAQELDPLHPDLTTALQQIAATIEQRDYSAAMSKGYAALRDNDTEAAARFFEAAAGIRPDAEEVSQAIRQAKDQHSTNIINRHLQAARGYESAENWQGALQQWGEALAVDANLVIADQGFKRAQNRRDLDVFFSTVIREPLRLSDDEVYAQTQQLMTDLQQVSAAGPRLQAQISEVQELLSLIRKPVSIRIESDGMTNVTIRRISELGMLTTRTVELLPGEYVATGVREGYRDVRVEFTIGVGQQAPVISVACDEAI